MTTHAQKPTFVPLVRIQPRAKVGLREIKSGSKLGLSTRPNQTRDHGLADFLLPLGYSSWKLP